MLNRSLPRQSISKRISCDKKRKKRGLLTDDPFPGRLEAGCTDPKIRIDVAEGRKMMTADDDRY
jgi:hypothetical protein